MLPEVLSKWWVTFASGMDTITIDKRGYEPIKSKLAKLKSLTIFRL
jgi:predicted metalloendopeptidase